MDFKSFKAPYLPYDQIRTEAENFLNQYVKTDDLPIEIEEIIDCDLEINIIPVNSLRRGFEVEAFISNDFKSLYVDNQVYEKFEYRYRFSLAHEIDHYYLHRDIYQQFQFSNVEEWKQIIENIPIKEYSWLEKQAYDFAGLVLVPDFALQNRFDNAVGKLKSQGYSPKDFDQDILLEFICRYLKEDFQVSDQVIRKRLAKNDISFA